MVTRWFRTLVFFALVAPAVGLADRVQDARDALASGDRDAAVIHLKNALVEDPGDSVARLLLGKVYLLQGDGASAEKELRRARALELPRDDWEVPLAEAYLLQGHASELLSEIPLDAGRELSTQATVLSLHGRAHLMREEFAAAAERFDEALAINADEYRALFGKAELLLTQERNADALALAERAVSLEPERPEMHTLIAQLHLRAGDEERGLGSLDRALQSDPTYADALYLRAGYLAGRGEQERALADIMTLRRAHPNNVGALYLGATIAFDQGEFALAQEQAGMVLRVAPQHPRSLVIYGVTALLLGQEEIAADYLNRARAVGAPQPEVRKLVAAIHIRRGSYDRAIDALGNGVLESDDVQAIVLLGTAYLSKGDELRGREAYARAIELAPSLPQLRTQLGAGLLQLGDEQGGMQMLQSAVDLAGGAVQPGIVLVMGHLHRGDLAAAKDAAEPLYRDNPDDVSILTLSGVVLLAADDEDTAEARFRRVLEIDPDNLNARIQLARVALSRRDNLAAEREFRKILVVDTQNFDAMIGLAALADAAGDTDAVEKWSAQAREAQPGAVQPDLLLLNHYLAVGRAADAERIGGDLLQREPDNATVLYHAARAKLAVGNSQAAIAHLRGAVGSDDATPAVSLLLAQTLLQAGDANGARNALKPLLAAEPEHFEATALLAAIELRSGNAQAAFDLAQRLVDTHPERAEGHRLVGILLARAGQPDAAETALRKAYGIAKSGEVAGLLARLALAAGRPSDAAAVLEDWLKDTPDDTAVRRQLAVLYQQSAQPANAARHYEALLDAQPEDFAALNNLAWIRFEAGDGRAATLAERAYRAAPDNPAVLDTYGWIMFKHSGESREALRVLKQARLFKPDDPTIRYHLASVLAAEGQSDEARAELRSLLSRSPQFDEAADARALLDRLGG